MTADPNNHQNKLLLINVCTLDSIANNIFKNFKNYESIVL